AAAVLLAGRVGPVRGGGGGTATGLRGHRGQVGGLLGGSVVWEGLQDYYPRLYHYEEGMSNSLCPAAGAVWAVAVAYLVDRDGPV
ncbi:hypothetical protein PUR61_00800, partial [Streptomyces sp. BE20]|uniref:hypothetical protein n=1 Tax=Streptomyces sp. BE20 TaxID=3002525 RepID=UPI002E7C7386|nr:hypothetical protein [Streptomyces sp. BE20]